MTPDSLSALDEMSGHNDTDDDIPHKRHKRKIPACDKSHEQKHRQRHQNRNADGAYRMRVEHFQRFDIRCDHGDDAALLLTFEFGGAEHAERTENLVAQNRQQFEGNIVVAVLFEVTQTAAHDAAADGNADDRAPTRAGSPRINQGIPKAFAIPVAPATVTPIAARNPIEPLMTARIMI